MFPLVVVQDELPVLEGSFQHVLTVLHVWPSAQTRCVIREQEEIDRLRRLLHLSCPPEFFGRRIFTDERKIIEILRTKTNTDALIGDSQHSRFQVLHDAGMIN